MSEPSSAGGNRRRSGNRRRRSGQVKRVELWRAVPELPEPEPVEPVKDASAVLRSLDTPPLPGQAVVAMHRFAAVAVEAAKTATALAAAGGLLADDGDDTDDEID